MRRIFLLSFLIILFFLPKAARADENFQIYQEINYEVQEDGRTIVSHDFNLTNKRADVYASQYSLTFQEVSIAKVQASDQNGPIKPEVSQQGRKTTIVLVFNQTMAGKDKSFAFTLNYEALNLAQQNGQIWEINIPKFNAKDESSENQIVLTIPTSLGRLALMRPAALKSEAGNDHQRYYFDYRQVALSGINASFGEFQIFDFVLTYHLDNPTKSKITTEIALPPDTAFQQVLYQKIEPPPVNVRVDSDGNWLARYQLQPQDKINIDAIGQTKIFSQPRSSFLIPNRETLEKNLADQPQYWPVNNPAIQEKAAQLANPEAIYNFVVDHLNYDLSRVNNGGVRLGALSALQNPSRAICTEFTDLFVTLARAAGIPAREINGYAYTTNSEIRPLGLVSDILHAWPEYWDEYRQFWVPVDPTWGKTTNGVDYFSKTDMNHFAFAIHGQKEDFPYPAGAYKATDSNSKDVQVAFGQKLLDDDSQLAVSFNLPGSITITNTGRSALYHLKPEVSSKTLIVNFPKAVDKNIPVLPPFARWEIELDLQSIKPVNFKDNFINLEVNDQKFSQAVRVYAFPWQVALGILLGVSFAAAVILTRPWHYVRKK